MSQEFREVVGELKKFALYTRGQFQDWFFSVGKKDLDVGEMVRALATMKKKLEELLQRLVRAYGTVSPRLERLLRHSIFVRWFKTNSLERDLEHMISTSILNELSRLLADCDALAGGHGKMAMGALKEDLDLAVVELNSLGGLCAEILSLIDKDTRLGQA